MIYGYARVSSKNQERYGNSLEDQVQKLREAGVAPSNIYQDSYTGTKMDRPQFSKLMKTLKPGDTLVVTKLDRFARTAADGAHQIQALLNNQISVHILNMGKADNTPMGKLMVTIMFAFAEFERDMIVERTQTGKATARATNPAWREGRKPLKISRSEVIDYMRRIQAREMTVLQCCERLNISKSSWYNLTRKILEK
jgi:DNA invertase Pin-like site-specific DNA recombinase